MRALKIHQLTHLEIFQETQLPGEVHGMQQGDQGSCHQRAARATAGDLLPPVVDPGATDVWHVAMSPTKERPWRGRSLGGKPW